MTRLSTITLAFAALFSFAAPIGAQVQERTLEASTDTVSVEKDRVLFALKTNLVYDLLTMLNLDVEIPVGKNVSVMWEDVFPWWHSGNKTCLQHWEMGPELRFWFRGRNAQPDGKLSGWFVGAYGMTSKYDFQITDKIDYQGEYWSAGLSAGWSKILGKGVFFRARPARLELSVAAGYLRTDYRHYLPADDYSMLIRDRYNAGSVSYFGPTKLKVSLVLPIWGKYDPSERAAKRMRK